MLAANVAHDIAGILLWFVGRLRVQEPRVSAAYLLVALGRSNWWAALKVTRARTHRTHMHANTPRMQTHVHVNVTLHVYTVYRQLPIP